MRDADHAKMNTMPPPVTDTWGAIVLRESELGRLEGIVPPDLIGNRSGGCAVRSGGWSVGYRVYE